MNISQIEKVTGLYRKLAQVPNLLNGRILLKNDFGYIINTTWSQRNLEIGSKTTFNRCFLVNYDLTKSADICSNDLTKELVSTVSSSEQMRAVIREESSKNESKQILEVWNKEHLKRSVDLAALDVHGLIYTDSTFKSFHFSPCEKKLLYVAEKKVPKSEAFYKRKPPTDKEKESEKDAEKIKGEEYIYRQDWGEQLVGKVKSVICVYDIENDVIKVHDELPDELCPGQVQWCKENIVGMAFNIMPRKLGLYACTSRNSEIFIFDGDKIYRRLSNEKRSVRSPRVSPNGDCIVWLERPFGGPHHCCMALMKLKLPISSESKPEVIVDIVDDIKIIRHNRKFYGIYCQDLPLQCFSADGNRLLFSTPQQNEIFSYVVDLNSCEITEIEFADGSLNILDVNNDLILANTSNFKSTDKILMGKLPECAKEQNIRWLQLNESMVIENLDKFQYEYMHFQQNNSDAVTEFSGIYFGPKEVPKKSVPLIVYIHGGPHGNFVNTYALSLSLHASLGFATLLVNFRGSTGTGQKSVYFLPSKIGSADVEDCVLATKICLEKFPELDNARVALVGGSHGGFLVGHISGQYPDLYRAVVSRNPVTDVASMYIVSDIPDWCSVEAGCEYTQEGPMNESLLIKQRTVSPIVHAHKVKAPTLLLIGSKDLRVPPSQGIEIYHRLKANGVKVRMNLYEDNHSLLTVPVEMDSQINGMLWLLEHTS